MTDEELVAMALDAGSMNRIVWDRCMEAMKSDPEMNRLMTADWKTRSRDTEGLIRDYYRHSDIWFVNTFCHGKGALDKLSALGSASTAEFQPWHKKFLEIMGSGRILDYGGGLWKDSYPFILAGYRVAQAEIRGPVTNLLKTFVEKMRLEHYASVVPVDNDVPIQEQYDGIVCFETLEHVVKPVELTRHLVNHLRQGGPLALSVSFGAPEHAPYHVATNAHLGDKNVWHGHLKLMGLTLEWTAEDGHRQIWRKS